MARAEEIDGLTAKDDITCGVVYFRSPRQLLVLTGAPFMFSHDRDLAKVGGANAGAQGHLRGHDGEHYCAAAESRGQDRYWADARSEDSSRRRGWKALIW